MIKGSCCVLLAGYTLPIHRKPPSHMHCAITSKMTLQGHGITLTGCCLLFFYYSFFSLFFFLSGTCCVVLNINRDCLQQITNVLHTGKMDRKQSLKEKQKPWGGGQRRRKKKFSIFLAFSYLAVIWCSTVVSF